MCSPNFRKPLREYPDESLGVEMSVSPGRVRGPSEPPLLEVEEEPVLQGGHLAAGGLRSVRAVRVTH